VDGGFFNSLLAMMINKAIKNIFLLAPPVVILFLVSVAFADSVEPSGQVLDAGTITGQFKIKNGGPLSGGQVVFYEATAGQPHSDKYERTPDYVRLLDEDGRFSVDLPAGRYFIRAVKRLSGERIGPPKEGDYICRIVDEKMQPTEYRIESGKVLDIGTIAEAIPMSKKQTGRHVVSTAVEGVIFDTKGKPVAHVVVAAFLEPVAQSKPVFTSERTGRNGKYVLRLAPGTYYLRARHASLGGPPQQGQIVGYYGKEKPFPVAVKEGQVLKGIDFGVLIFPGRGPIPDRNSEKQKTNFPEKAPESETERARRAQ
jgi:hypothetical protein